MEVDASALTFFNPAIIVVRFVVVYQNPTTKVDRGEGEFAKRVTDFRLTIEVEGNDPWLRQTWDRKGGLK